MCVRKTAPYEGPNLTLPGTVVAVGSASSIGIDVRIATVNVRLSLNDDDSSVVDHVVVGRDAHFKRTFTEANLHIIGVQEGHAHEARTWSSGGYFRLCSGPDSKHNTGDVELWCSLDLPWGEASANEVFFTKDMVTVQFAEKRFIIVAIRAPWFSYDVVVCHAPHSWTKSG